MSASIARETALPSRTDRARADPTKSGGVHFTPPELAEFIARHAWECLGPLDRVRVLDPACGDGALLAAVVESAPEGVGLEIVGFDTDRDSVEAARERLSDVLALSADVDLRHGDFLEWIQKEGSGTLFDLASAKPGLGSFDFVIANPPYVRTQVLGAERARELSSAFRISGRVDLYHAFLLGMSLALREGGVLGLVCSNRFLTTKTGRGLRQHLSHSYDLQHIYDLGDTRLFSAAVLPAVVIGKRDSDGSQACEFTSAYEARDTDRTPTEVVRYESVVSALEAEESLAAMVDSIGYRVSCGTLANLRDDAPWVVPTSDALANIEPATASRFSALGKIRVGIKTTADPVFIRCDWSEVDPAVRPEPEIILPLLTHHVAERWRARSTSRGVLYPYDLAEPKRTPLDLQCWPRAAAYLDAHRERLEGRRYVTEGGRHWWEIWVPQRPSAWAGPKIVFPDISEEPKFFIDWSGAVVNGDCYWIPFSEGQTDLAYLTIAVGNSALGTQFYDDTCGNKLYAGRRRYITQYVERFPLPDPDSPTAHKIAEVVSQLCRADQDPDDVIEMEREVDSLVWRSFGLEEPTRQGDL